MALTKECKQEMEHLLTLVERQKQYRTGVVFPSRMNNYFYDAGTGKILRLQDEEYRLLKAIFSPQATVKTVMQAFSEEAPDKVEAFLRNTAQMNLLRMPPLETLCCDYHEDICQQIDHNLAQLILEVTQRCNFRCKYCIYNSSYEGNHDFSAANMSWDTAKQAIDYLFAHSAERKNIYLTFYGGEPLLQFDLIKQATLYAQNLATQESRNLYFNLTTNLSLMTAEMPGSLLTFPIFH